MVPSRIIDPDITNQRNNKSYSSRSIKIAPSGSDIKACSSIALSSHSGGIDGRPIGV